MLYNKCIKNTNKSCLMRQNKNLACCEDDIQADIDLLHPTLDKITQSLTPASFDISIFSKTIFIVTMLQADEDELDSSVKEIISNISYFCYSTQQKTPSEECVLLGTSFIKDTLRWINYKLFFHPLGNKENYIKSLRSDSETIISLMGNCDSTESSDDADSLFF